MVLLEFIMSINGNQDDAKYLVRSDREKLNLIAKFICFIHRNSADVTADDVCNTIKDITINEVDNELEVILDMWIASEKMQKILNGDEVRH